MIPRNFDLSKGQWMYSKNNHKFSWRHLFYWLLKLHSYRWQLLLNFTETYATLISQTCATPVPFVSDHSPVLALLSYVMTNLVDELQIYTLLSHNCTW